MNGTMTVELVRKMGEAQYAYCHECETWLGCQYWPLANSVWMHKNGTGHKPTLYRIAADQS
jgi:hypothetical protein